MKQNKQAFTLIELLVVVLIIGILAAVALPQYQIAVGKAQITQGITLCANLELAQKAYFLANGNYAHKFTDLDIDMPAGGTFNSNKDLIVYPNFALSMEGQAHNDWYCGVLFKPRKIQYYRYWQASPNASYSYQIDCRAADSDKAANSICKALGGIYSHSWEGTGGKWNAYIIEQKK